MADIEIKSLRVSAQMDSSQYVAGMKQKEAADKAGVASSRELGQAVAANDSKISQAGDVMGRLSKQYLDGFGAQQRFASGLNQLQRALDTGKTTIEGAANILVGMNQKLGLTGDVTALVAKGQTSLAEAMSMANTTIAAQQGTLSRAVGEWQIYIAQLKEAQAAQNSAQFASANQNKFNTLLGVQTQPSSSARESASVFAAGLQDIDNIAQLKAQQIGQNFSDDLDRSLVAGTSKAARDAAAVFSTELDRIDALAQLKATQIGANFQSDLNASFGIGAGGGSARASASVFEEAGREADQMAARVAALRAELNPLAATQDRVNAELSEYSALAAKGAISAEELAQAQAMVRNRAAANQNQGGLGRFGAMNATSQFQDIAVTAAMGQSPMTIALQQGTQLGMAMQMQMGDQGAKGIVKGLGTAFMGLLTPINLVAIGLTGVAAVAIQFGSKLLPQVKSLKDATEDQRKAVMDLAEAYGMAGVKAEDFNRKSHLAAAAAARSDTDDLRKTADRANRDALGQLTTFITPGRSAGGFFGPTQNEFRPFNDAIQELNTQVRSGHPDFALFESNIRAVVAENPGLQSTADKILGIVAAATDAANQLGKTANVLDRINEIRFPERGILPKGAAGDELAVAEIAARNRSQRQFEADRVALDAKSPQELAAAARAHEGATFDSNETAGMRRDRIELAGKKALIEAEHALKEAQDQRLRSLNQTLAAAQLDVDLVGKTTAEVEGLRMAAQLEAQVRETAAQNHVKADEAEIAKIKEKAAEYGKLKAIEEARSTIHGQEQDIETQRAELGLIGQNTLAHDRAIASLKAEQEIRKLGIPLYGQEAEAIRANTAELSALAEAAAKAKLASDLAFERRQMFRSPDDQQVASRLQSAGLPDDLNSTEAAAIRANQALEKMKETWDSIFDTARSGIDSVVDSLFNGGKDIGEVLKGVGRDFAKQMFDLALTNPLKNWLTGSNLNSIADLGIFGSGASSGKGGGFGGVLGGLLGAQKAVASMQVQAAVVNVNGGVAGGLGSLTGASGAANNNSSGGIFGWVKSLFGGSGATTTAANSNDPWAGMRGVTGLFSGGSTSLTGNMASYASAIKMIESAGSGGYSALGPMLRNGNQALGAYQVMSSNLPSWSREAFGSTMSPSQFLNNPAAQDTIFQQQFGKLLSKFGNSNDAASAWFTGGPLSTRAGATDILGTSGSQYVDKFNTALEKVTGSAASLTGAASTAATGLSSVGGGLNQLGSALSQFPAAPGGGGGGGGLFSWLGGLFGGGGGGNGLPAGFGLNSAFKGEAAYSWLLANPGGFSGLFHEGGIAGYSARTRYVSDMGIFKHAQRLHSGGFAGLGADEVPAVLKRGEPVFKSMEHARQVVGGNDNGNVEAIVNALASKLKLNVKNINLYDPSVVGDYTRTDDGEQAVVNVMRRTGSGRGL